MPDLDALLGNRALRGVDATTRAVRAWQRIQDKPTVIAVYTSTGAVKATMTVRIEYPRGPNIRTAAGVGDATRHEVIVFGVTDHPTIADTALAKGDLFSLDDGSYRVQSVWGLPGELQARAERIS